MGQCFFPLSAGLVLSWYYLLFETSLSHQTVISLRAETVSVCVQCSPQCLAQCLTVGIQCMITKGVNKRLKDTRSWDSRPVRVGRCHSTVHDCTWVQSGSQSSEMPVLSSVKCYKNLRDTNKDTEPMTVEAPTSLWGAILMLTPVFDWPPIPDHLKP